MVNNYKIPIGMSEEEIKEFFNKYSLIELDMLNVIFSYVHEYDMSLVMNVLERIRKERYQAYQNDFEVPIASCDYLDCFINKNSLLCDKELNFFKELVEDASFFLSDLRSNSYVYEQLFSEFSTADYPIDIVYSLEESLQNESDNRVCMIKKL